MLIGGAITGGIEMISQLSQVSWNFRCLNWAEIGFAAGAGAVGGMLGFAGAALGVSIAGSGLMGALLAGSMGGLASGVGIRTAQTAVSGHWENWQNDIFNPGQMAADLAFGAIGGGVGYGVQKLLRVVARNILQNITSNANQRLGSNPSLARTVLSARAYESAQRSPGIARMQYGNAVERMARDQIRDSRTLQSLFIYRAGPSNPDFIGRGLFRGMDFDITTNTTRSIVSHQSRPYGNNLLITTYSRPSNFRIFP